MDTYYAMLGIDPHASQDEITAAYQRQRQQYSPERVATMDDDIQEVARQRTAELERAYEVLSDPQQRQRYDASISVAAENAQPAPTAPAQTAGKSGKLSTRELWYAAGGVLVALLLIGAVWLFTDSDEQIMAGEVNRPAPALTLPTLDGGEIRLSDYEGQVVLVNFWGTWCEPCKRETPALQAAYEELQDQGFVVVGVNLTDSELSQGTSEEDIATFVESYHVTYPVALDRENTAVEAFRVNPLPTSFFIDTEGTIRYVRISEVTQEEITTLFHKLQQESTAQHN